MTRTLFSIPAARVHELRGSQILISISTEESTALITLAASISNDGSALEILLTKFLTACEERKKGQKTFKNLSDFIKHVLFNETNLAILEDEVIIIHVMCNFMILFSCRQLS